MTSPGPTMGVAGAHAGVNSNVLTDEDVVEPLTGTAVLNGIPVTVEPARAVAAPPNPPPRWGSRTSAGAVSHPNPGLGVPPFPRSGRAVKVSVAHARPAPQGLLP